jgi:hypothetical protein
MDSSPNLPARRPRHDGWTAERQAAFLKALAASGCVTYACRAAGMSRESAYELYNRSSAYDFRRGWDAALDCSLRLVEDEAWSRAVNGVARPVFYRGEQVGEYRHYDERLTMFLLRFRRPHRYCELRKLPPPLLPPGSEDDGPDPDEAIGELAFHLEDLVDQAAGTPSIDGVNIVNFVGNEPPNAATPALGVAGAAGTDGQAPLPPQSPE